MILAIKTDNPKAELCVLDNVGTEIRNELWLAGHELSQQLLSKIEALLPEGLGKVSGVVVFKGPGSFTGLRIGITVANTLAYGLGVPVVGTSGKNWAKDGVAQLSSSQASHYVVPEYGAEPNITRPKK